ncbi:MAG: hypothetical protein PW843_03925 [Azospirillaceae bacterium]|nr:hypothetical protein [Azospirillaceae bacterium]
MLNVGRAQQRARQRHTPGPLTAPTVLLRANGAAQIDPGWQALIHPPCTVVPVGGDHVTMMAEAHAPALAAALRPFLVAAAG